MLGVVRLLLLLLVSGVAVAMATDSAAAASVQCVGNGVVCVSAAACDASFGEVHSGGACTRADAVCCIVGVKLQFARLAHLDAATRKRETKRQFSSLLGNLGTLGKIASTVSGVAGLVGATGLQNTLDGVGKLAGAAGNLGSGLSALSGAAGAVSSLTNAAGAVSNLAGMIPTTLPSLNVPTFPSVPSDYTLPTFPTDPPGGYTTPPYTLPSTLPKPNTNPHTGLPIGVDPNNPLGLNKNAQGQFINEYGVVVDKFGNPTVYTTYQAYTTAPQPQFTTAPTSPINIQTVPGGLAGQESDVEAGQLTMAGAMEGLPVGAYVGIGVVGFLCLMLVCVLIYCATTRSRNNLEYNVSNTAYDPNAQGASALWAMQPNAASNNFGSFNQSNTAAFGGSPATGAAAFGAGFGGFNGANSTADASELGRHGNPRQNFGAFNGGGTGVMQPSYTGTVNNIPVPGASFGRDRFVTANDLPAPAGPLRKDTENAAYGLSSPTGGPSTTFVGGEEYAQQYGTQYQADAFVCRQCGNRYNYQSDLDAHKAARGHSDDMNGF